ncbi:hypothetical protein [Candidatus Mesenet endosymbiont of Phosphuga atrata]|uniref:hypothetical protein n=1 Tax=Candidatus Mesenet endosymbiont of Phosphuga atrata TaxID=3066221 RepID=UPI0030D5D99A
MNIVLNDNHSASKLEQFKELYQEFSSICDNTYELSNLGLEVDLTKYITRLNLTKFKVEPIKLDLPSLGVKPDFFNLNLIKPAYECTSEEREKKEESKSPKYMFNKFMGLSEEQRRSFYCLNPQYDINRPANSPIFNWNSNTTPNVIPRPYYEDNELHRLASKTPMSDNDIEEKIVMCELLFIAIT